MPGSFGSLREFNKKYIVTENYEDLKSHLEPYFLRRTKKEVLADKLPRKHDLMVSKVSASPTQANLAEAIWSGVVGASSQKMRGVVLEALIKLRQMYGHPNLVLSQEQHEPILSTPKMKKFQEIVEKVHANGEKILVFTEFLPLQDLIRQWASETYHLHLPVINGMTSQRQSVVQMFNEKTGFSLMVLSPKAAGVGLNITSANHVLHFTRWWNPAVENQATDRVYRIGQTREVFVYTIITEDAVNFPNGTVEEHIHKLLENRQALADDVIRPYVEEEIWKLIHDSMIL
jgi:SNF2 family DNA or RNA helicase